MGNTTALTSLSTNAAGSTRLAGGSVTTSGNQSYQDAVTLVSNLVVSGANVTFGASVNGPFGLAINGGKAALNGAVGDVSPLSSLNVTSSQSLHITTAIRTSSDVVLTVNDLPSSGQDIVIISAGSILSNAGKILLRAGDDVQLQPGSSLSTSGLTELVGDYGNADVGVGSILTLSGMLQASSASVSSGSDNDTVLIDDNGATTGGTVNHIRAPLTVNPGLGQDVLILNDASETAPTMLTLTAMSIGAEPGDNFFTAGGSLTYSNVDDLQILTGSAADVIEIGATIRAAHSSAQVVVLTKSPSSRQPV